MKFETRNVLSPKQNVLIKVNREKWSMADTWLILYLPCEKRKKKEEERELLVRVSSFLRYIPQI